VIQVRRDDQFPVIGRETRSAIRLAGRTAAIR
jgi:hypothetical protein